MLLRDVTLPCWGEAAMVFTIRSYPYDPDKWTKGTELDRRNHNTQAS